MSRARKHIRALALGGIVALVSVLVFAAPVAAHDELLASTPASGEQLAAPPASVSLTFSADVLTLGAAIVVVDQSGRDWVAGEPIVAEGLVTAPLDGNLPEAGYEIRWRVVSSDGHPISGLIPFTVGDAEPLERAAATPPVGAASTEQNTQELSTSEDGAALRVVLVGVGGAVFALVALFLISLLRRRSRAGDPDDETTSSSSGNNSERHDL